MRFNPCACFGAALHVCPLGWCCSKKQDKLFERNPISNIVYCIRCFHVQYLVCKTWCGRPPLDQKD